MCAINGMASSQLLHLASAWYADSCQNKAVTLQQIVAATVQFSLWRVYSLEPLSLLATVCELWKRRGGGECTEEEWGQVEEWQAALNSGCHLYLLRSCATVAACLHLSIYSLCVCPLSNYIASSTGAMFNLVQKLKVCVLLMAWHHHNCFISPLRGMQTVVKARLLPPSLSLFPACVVVWVFLSQASLETPTTTNDGELWFSWLLTVVTTEPAERIGWRL